jgi:uncharacterized protein YaiL (DUF2058 family)
MKKPSTLSLQQQLLQSGLTTDAKLKQVKSEKRKQNKQATTVDTADAAKHSAEHSRLQQAERDRELNRQRKQAEDQKALQAQIKQLIDQHALPQDPDGVAYQFSHHNKIKTVYVTETTRQALINGRAGIVLNDAHYAIVPIETALKIQARDADCLLLLNPHASDANEIDDAYAAFTVPDDLMW